MNKHLAALRENIIAETVADYPRIYTTQETALDILSVLAKEKCA